MKISFIFCVYNEYKNLVSNLKKTEDYISNQINDYEIIIIDNNSNDGSAEFIRNYYSKKIKKYLNKKNIGKGGSTKIGLENARLTALNQRNTLRQTIEQVYLDVKSNNKE